MYFPYDVEEEFGTKGRVPVKATFDGVPYSGSMVKYGAPQHMLGILKNIREQIGKGPGDMVEVTIEKDETERTVDVPPEFQKLLKKEKLLARASRNSATPTSGNIAAGSPGPSATRHAPTGSRRPWKCCVVESKRPTVRVDNSGLGTGPRKFDTAQPLLRDSEMLPVGPIVPGPCPVPKWRNWQTRVVQVHVLARVWGFESLLRHQ